MRGIYDIHCHILPGADDGSKSMDESIEMLKMQYADGVRAIILTPHYRKNMFETPEEVIVQKFGSLQQIAAEKLSTDLKLYLGCELHTSMDMLELFHLRKHLTLAGSSFVLTEFSNSDSESYVKERCYQLLSNGYHPILAHIERYACTYKNLDFVDELRQMGMRMQVNAGSITGSEGRSVKRYCRKLMKRDLLDFVGSDSHGTRKRPPEMGACAAAMEKQMGSSYAKHILIENPSGIIEENHE